MSEVQLLICDAQQSLHAHQHGAFADRVIAALSAEPETIDELDRAMERFIAADGSSYFSGFRPGVDDRPWDAGLVVVDLAARLVVCESTYSMATREGCVGYHDGKCLTNVGVSYHLSDDWHLMYYAEGWEATADKRRRDRLEHPPLDTRAILYGEPLLKFIARECFESFRDRPVVAEPDYKNLEYEQEYDLVRQIHVRWMMTPREDLRGQTPRQVMVSHRSVIAWDLQDRKLQWTDMDRCPRGIDPESAAYRLGGFGTHEMVVYYEMVRHLLWRCREAVARHLQDLAATPLSIEDFVASEVPFLIELRDQWLHSPDHEFTSRTPRDIIHNERARLPMAVSGHEAMIDPDCPLCQLQEELPGPTFWNLDGSSMDDEFAFATWHDTLEEWEQEQRRHEEFSRRFEAESAERKRLGVEYPGHGYASPESAWESSSSASESIGQSMLLRLFAVGFPLCEITVELKAPVEQRDLIDRLSRAFGNLREVAQCPDPARADALIEPVLTSFCDTLEAVATARPDLAPKCARLQDRLRRFLEPPGKAQSAPDMLDDDNDLPF